MSGLKCHLIESLIMQFALCPVSHDAKFVSNEPFAKRLWNRPAVSLNMHRKSGNEIEEGSETKHGLDRAYTPVLRCQTQWGEKPALSSKKEKKKRRKTHIILLFIVASSKISRLLFHFWKVKLRERKECKYKSGLILTGRKSIKEHQYGEKPERKHLRHVQEHHEWWLNNTGILLLFKHIHINYQSIN